LREQRGRWRGTSKPEAVAAVVAGLQIVGYEVDRCCVLLGVDGRGWLA